MKLPSLPNYDAESAHEELASSASAEKPSAYPFDSQTLPPPADWSAAAVRLLQGVVYSDESQSVWESILANISPLTEYFGKLGLLLVVDEADTMAYLRQPDDEEIPDEFQSVPRLFRRSPLGYDTSLLCVLLRDELRQFEEEDLQNERCVIAQHDLLAVWKAFFPNELDEVKLNRSLAASLRKLEELKFVKQFEKDPVSWEVRRIIKARLPLSDLEQLRQALVAAVAGNSDAPDDRSTEHE